jgi:glycosyltransferase involved in cell wall biosynthesis
MSVGKNFDWDSYEAPSFKAPTRFGGLFVVTEAVTKRLPYPMRVFAWSGEIKNSKYAPPSFELYHGVRICRPDKGVMVEKYEKYGEEYKVSKISSQRELTDPEIDASIKSVFEHADIMHLDDIHYPALLQLGSYGRSILNYSLAIADYSDSTVKISNDWHTILGGYLTTRLINPEIPWGVFIHSDEQGRIGGVSHRGNVVSEEYRNGRYAGNRLIRDLEMIGVKEADLVLTPSKLMVEELKFLAKAHGVSEEQLEKIFPIYHGVDTKAYRPIEVERPEKRRLFYVGRLARVKGVDSLIKIYKILKTEFQDLELKLVGDGELTPQIRKLQKTMPDLILDINWLSIDRKAEEMNKASICVFPSLYEPSGQTHFESMACQRPTVIGNGGWREHTVDGTTAVWIDPCDPKKAAEKIRDLLVNEKESEEMARNGRESVVKLYDWDEVVKRAYPRVFESLLSRDVERLRELETELCPNPSLL